MTNRKRDGYNHSPPIRGHLAARHTLLAEVLLGWQTISLGISGQTGGDSGLLHNILLNMGLANTWGYYLIFVGYLMLQNAGIEFWLGRRWGDKYVRLMAGARRMGALGSVFAWIIIAYLEFRTPLNGFKTLAWMVPVNLSMSAYIFWETTRVYFFLGTFSHGSRAQ